MATGNFYIENRCIVVTNDDYELGNVPTLKKEWDNNRNYSGRYLAISDDFLFFDILLRSGYYEHSNIDYERNNVSAVDWLGASHYYNTKKELVEQVIEEFGGRFPISKHKLYMVVGKIGEQDFNSWYWEAVERITDYLAELEEAKVNKALDQLKNAYGYEEYQVAYRFSNGETGYAKVV